MCIPYIKSKSYFCLIIFYFLLAGRLSALEMLKWVLIILLPQIQKVCYRLQFGKLWAILIWGETTFYIYTFNEEYGSYKSMFCPTLLPSSMGLPILASNTSSMVWISISRHIISYMLYAALPLKIALIWFNSLIFHSSKWFFSVS